MEHVYSFLLLTTLPTHEFSRESAVLKWKVLSCPTMKPNGLLRMPVWTASPSCVDIYEAQRGARRGLPGRSTSQGGSAHSVSPALSAFPRGRQSSNMETHFKALALGLPGMKTQRGAFLPGRHKRTLFHWQARMPRVQGAALSTWK